MNPTTAISRSRGWAAAAVLACFPLFGAAAQGAPSALGGTFSQLQPRQQALVQRWVEEYKVVYKRQLNPETIYNNLPLSARTTFQAVTHALMNSKLTSQDGKAMGTALDLVDVVERFAGQVPDTRGDRQFRIYVYLKPGAVNKLYSAKEFEREHDNTIFHIGYPINFRQQGGVPSLQFCIAKTGRRADIDVDYRSSAGVKALVSGHLTSANSDVRAGQNPAVHNRRWNGLSNWWADLMAVLVEKAALKEPEEGLTPGAEMERKRIAHGPIHEAIHTYLSDWLIRQQPEELLPLISIKTYPCVAEQGGDARPDSKMALLRILKGMQDRNKALGKVERLEDVVSAVSYRLPDSVAVTHPYQRLFSIQEVPDDVAWAIDCRVRYKLQMAESIPRPSHKLNKTFVVSMHIKDTKAPEAFVVHTWKQEAGEWRLISIDIKRKTLSPPADLLSAAEPLPAPDSDAARLSSEAEKLITSWLVKRKPGEAMRFFLPESYACDALAESHTGRPAQADAGDSRKLAAFLAEAAKLSLPNEKLEGVIEAVEAGHHELKPLTHQRAGAFLLAEVTGDLLRMSDCRFDRRALSQSSKADSAAGKGMATSFRLVQAQAGEAAAITLYWKKSPDGWRVASYQVSAD